MRPEAPPHRPAATPYHRPAAALRAWLVDTAGGLPATFWYLWAGLLINRAGAFAMLFLPLYLTAVRGASESLAGVVVGAFGAGGAAGVLLGGVLADRWGRRATLVAAHLATAVLMVALALSQHLGVIAALALLVGVTHAMPSPAFVAAIVDVVPEARRSRAFNLQFWAFNLGMAVASLLAGLLAEASYLALFLVDAAATLATAVVIAWKVPETINRAAASATAPMRPAPSASAPPGRPGPTGRHAPARSSLPVTGSRRPGLHTALTDRPFMVFVGLTFVLAVLTTQTSTIMPLAMRADGLGPSAYGTVMALGGVLIVLGQLFVPRLIDRHRKAHVLAVSTALLAIGFGALAIADRARPLPGRLRGLDGRFDAGRATQRTDQRGAGATRPAGPLPVGVLPGLPGRVVRRAHARRNQPATVGRCPLADRRRGGVAGRRRPPARRPVPGTSRVGPASVGGRGRRRALVCRRRPLTEPRERSNGTTGGGGRSSPP